MMEEEIIRLMQGKGWIYLKDLIAPIPANERMSIIIYLHHMIDEGKAEHHFCLVDKSGKELISTKDLSEFNFQDGTYEDCDIISKFRLLDGAVT